MLFKPFCISFHCCSTAINSFSINFWSFFSLKSYRCVRFPKVAKKTLGTKLRQWKETPRMRLFISHLSTCSSYTLHCAINTRTAKHWTENCIFLAKRKRKLENSHHMRSFIISLRYGATQHMDNGQFERKLASNICHDSKFDNGSQRRKKRVRIEREENVRKKGLAIVPSESDVLSKKQIYTFR